LVRMERLLCKGHDSISCNDQAALAKRSSVSQPTISNIELLEKSVDNRKRTVSRQEILKVLINGLDMPGYKINVILWLYDGKLFSKTDFFEFNNIDRKRYEGNASRNQYTYKKLRDYTLKLLKKSLNTFESKSLTKEAVKSISSTNEEALLQSVEELYKVEKIPGHGVLVSKHPPFLIRPEETLKVHRDMSKKGQERLLYIHKERRKVFYSHVGYYGYKSIHQKSCMEKYLSNDPPYREINLKYRQEHIRQWIDILKTCPDYEIGMAEATFDMEIFNKNLACTMIRGSEFNDYLDFGMNPFCSLRFIHWKDEASTLRFFLECEESWDGIPVEDRDKGNVIDYLEDLLKHS